MVFIPYAGCGYVAVVKAVIREPKRLGNWAWSWKIQTFVGEMGVKFVIRAIK